MTDGQPLQVLGAESRVALLDALRIAGRPVAVAEAGAMLGLHPSTARFHLGLLASAGLVDREVERRGTAGRPRIRYVARASADARAGSPGEATPGRKATFVALSPPADGYERLASVLAGQLSGLADPAGAAHEAGRRWVEAFDVTPKTPAHPVAPDAALDAVAELMDRLGFAPDRPVADDRLMLRRCPFEAVAREHRTVVCGVHGGMLEQTFARLGGTVRVDGLDAFAGSEPLLCVVRLRRVAGAGTAGPPATRDDTVIAAAHRRSPRAAPRGTGHA